MTGIDQATSVLYQAAVWAQTAVGGPHYTGPGPNSMAAESPFTSYVAGVVVYTMAISFLVVVLLFGGILIVNLSMMSKREKDHVGGRTPSDVAILKGTLWPQQADSKISLPAEDDEDQSMVAQLMSAQPPGHDFDDPKRADQGFIDEPPQVA